MNSLILQSSMSLRIVKQEKLAYVKLNTQTPCPPRSDVLVNRENRVSAYFSLDPVPEFSDGCDFFKRCQQINSPKKEARTKILRTGL